MQRRHLLSLLPLYAAPALIGAGAARAQAPQRLIKIIVGYPAGGTADAVARIYAEGLQKRLGVTVLVDNKPGAGGQIAAELFRTMPADGSTLLLANSHMMATLPLTSKSVKYDPQKDFMPVARLANFEVALAVGTATPANTFAEYLALARAKQDARSYGIPAAGSSPQFVGYVIGRKEGIELLAVPYKGGAPLMTDLMGNQVPAAIDALGGMLDLHRTGKIRILAVTGPRRAAALPAVSTFAELGYASLERSSWVGLFAPLGSAPAFVERVSAGVAEVAALPETVSKLAGVGFDSAPGTPQVLREVVRDEFATWQPIIRESGFKVE